MTSSFSPAGTESASISVTKPYWYSFAANSSKVSLAVGMILPLVSKSGSQKFNAAPQVRVPANVNGD